jgi:hypothetical protein
MAAELLLRDTALTECPEHGLELCSQLLLLTFNPRAEILSTFAIQKAAVLIDHPNSA